MRTGAGREDVPDNFFFSGLDISGKRVYIYRSEMPAAVALRKQRGKSGLRRAGDPAVKAGSAAASAADGKRHREETARFRLVRDGQG